MGGKFGGQTQRYSPPAFAMANRPAGFVMPSSQGRGENQNQLPGSQNSTGGGRDNSNQQLAMAINAAKYGLGGSVFGPVGVLGGSAYGAWDELQRQKTEEIGDTSATNIRAVQQKKVFGSLLQDDDDTDDTGDSFGDRTSSPGGMGGV